MSSPQLTTVGIPSPPSFHTHSRSLSSQDLSQVLAKHSSPKQALVSAVQLHHPPNMPIMRQSSNSIGTTPASASTHRSLQGSYSELAAQLSDPATEMDDKEEDGSASGGGRGLSRAQSDDHARSPDDDDAGSVEEDEEYAGSTSGGHKKGSACLVCYRAKTSCDGERPCFRCCRLHKAESCVDRPADERHPRKRKTGPYVDRGVRSKRRGTASRRKAKLAALEAQAKCTAIKGVQDALLQRVQALFTAESAPDGVSVDRKRVHWIVSYMRHFMSEEDFEALMKEAPGLDATFQCAELGLVGAPQRSVRYTYDTSPLVGLTSPPSGLQRANSASASGEAAADEAGDASKDSAPTAAVGAQPLLQFEYGAATIEEPLPQSEEKKVHQASCPCAVVVENKPAEAAEATEAAPVEESAVKVEPESEGKTETADIPMSDAAPTTAAAESVEVAPTCTCPPPLRVHIAARVLVNLAWERLFGWSQEELVQLIVDNRETACGRMLRADSREIAITAALEALIAGQDEINSKGVIVSKWQSEIHCDYRVTRPPGAPTSDLTSCISYTPLANPRPPPMDSPISTTAGSPEPSTAATPPYSLSLQDSPDASASEALQVPSADENEAAAPPAAEAAVDSAPAEAPVSLPATTEAVATPTVTVVA